MLQVGCKSGYEVNLTPEKKQKVSVCGILRFFFFVFFKKNNFFFFCSVLPFSESFYIARCVLFILTSFTKKKKSFSVAHIMYFLRTNLKNKKSLKGHFYFI